MNRPAARCFNGRRRYGAISIRATIAPNSPKGANLIHNSIVRNRVAGASVRVCTEQSPDPFERGRHRTRHGARGQPRFVRQPAAGTGASAYDADSVITSSGVARMSR